MDRKQNAYASSRQAGSIWLRNRGESGDRRYYTRRRVHKTPSLFVGLSGSKQDRARPAPQNVNKSHLARLMNASKKTTCARARRRFSGLVSFGT